jgi:tRNA(Arg) A34 adenosine deaminase TadA
MDISLSLPDWVEGELKALPRQFKTTEEKMKAVIRFSRLNFERGTGGPFAAGVFERESGKLVTIGVNRVVACNCSSAHAEVMALSIAQKQLKTFDLGGSGMPAHELVVNWRPCAMCFGAVIWSGIRFLVIAGSGPELEKITGFDEGPIHPEWKKELARRGIELQDNVLHEEALAVCRDFAKSGALVYNGRRG